MCFATSKKIENHSPEVEIRLVLKAWWEVGELLSLPGNVVNLIDVKFENSNAPNNKQFC